MRTFAYFFIAGVAFFATHSNALAHVPVLTDFRTQTDNIAVEDPTLSQAFYAELEGFPHSYLIDTEEPFLLYTEILVPDIEGSKNIFSGVIIKIPEEGGRVTEVARLSAKEAVWNPQFEPFGGDSYRHGPSFEGEVEAGTYRIEVNTPDNEGKYVLVVGTREESTLGYFELLGRLIEVKRFFEKTPLHVIQSPFAYIPLGLLFLIIGGVMYYRKRKSVRV